MSKEIVVMCPICKDEFHTTSNLGDLEGCTICDEVFIIHEEDIRRDL